MIENHNKLVSVGMATYNDASYIKKAIKSLLTQSYNNFELIISDNASTDDTKSICLEFAKKDKRIRYIRQKKNMGMVANFNFVLKKAKGEYFMWASSDDFWHKEFIKKLYSLLEKNKDAVLAVSNFDNVYGDKHLYNLPINKKNLVDQYTCLIHYLKFGELSYFYGLYQTKIIKSIGGYHVDSRPFFKSSDYLTILKTLLKGKMVYTDEVLFFKRDTGYHFDRFELIKNLNLNKKVFKTILRYLCFPLFYIYNLFFSIKYILLSNFNLSQKSILSFYVFLSYLKNNLDFLRNIFLGFFYLFVGVYQKIIKKFFVF